MKSRGVSELRKEASLVNITIHTFKQWSHFGSPPHPAPGSQLSMWVLGMS